MSNRAYTILTPIVVTAIGVVTGLPFPSPFDPLPRLPILYPLRLLSPITPRLPSHSVLNPPYCPQVKANPPLPSSRHSNLPTRPQRRSSQPKPGFSLYIIIIIPHLNIPIHFFYISHLSNIPPAICPAPQNRNQRRQRRRRDYDPGFCAALGGGAGGAVCGAGGGVSVGGGAVGEV